MANKIKQIVLDYHSEHLRGVLSDRQLGHRYGLGWAEAFHFIGAIRSKVDEYITRHAVNL
jgi:hypothetical protein